MANNSALHDAASNGDVDQINQLLTNDNDIIKLKNNDEDLAYHCAAKGRHLEALKALTTYPNFERRLLKETNKEGKTPLHIALENKDEEMANHLMSQYGATCCVLNEDNVCPMYLAIDVGYWDLAKRMINYTKHNRQISLWDDEVRRGMSYWDYQLLQGKSIVHAAIKAKKQDILEHILENHGALIKSLDEKGRRPLSYAAFEGYLEGVVYLLKKFPSYAFERDKDDECNSYPIHSAASGGHINVIKELHSTIRFLDSKGQNVFHVAASRGQYDMVKYLMHIPGLEMLIKQKDINKNTPRKLAQDGSYDKLANMLKTMEQKLDNTFESKDDQQVMHVGKVKHEVPIGRQLYKFLMNGETDNISKLETKLWEVRSVEDNGSVLHMAAKAGQHHLIKHILPMCKDMNMIELENSEGDLVFHSAAKGGHFEALKVLTDWRNYSAEDEIKKDVLGVTNKEGNTPLHIALKLKQEKMVGHLINEYKGACYVLNGEDVSPLYLAIKAGYSDHAKTMLQAYKDRQLVLWGKSVIHAAIDAQNIDILKMILQNHKELVESFDEEGRRPLSYAAFKGYLKGVKCLLEQFPDCAYDHDEDGSIPIHNAASVGNIKVIKELYTTIRLLNKEGQNILHVAAMRGKYEVVYYLLERVELKQLIHQIDNNGNTPLHLGVKNLHPRTVYNLVKKKARLDVVNNDGMTPLDLANNYAQGSMDGTLTWLALVYAGAPQNSQSITDQDQQQSKKESESKNKTDQENQQQTKKLDNDKIKDSESKGGNYKYESTESMFIRKEVDKRESKHKEKFTSSHLLVATLVATVTFAAGFTFPGGYYQDGKDIGMATLAREWALKVFVIANTGAMYSSVLAVMILIWTQTNDDNDKLVSLSVIVAIPMLRFSLSMMSIAFMMGIFVVLKTRPVLAYLVLSIGCLFLLVLAIIFPIYSPSRRISIPIIRHFYNLRLYILMFIFAHLQA